MGNKSNLIDFGSGEQCEGGMGKLMDDRSNVSGIGANAEGDEGAGHQPNDRCNSPRDELHNNPEKKDTDGDQNRRHQNQ